MILNRSNPKGLHHETIGVDRKSRVTGQQFGLLFTHGFRLRSGLRMVPDGIPGHVRLPFHTRYQDGTSFQQFLVQRLVLENVVPILRFFWLCVFRNMY